MAQEEKARAYDEALERARKIHDQILNNELIGFPDQIREIFPQLRESEDERIRKEIIDFIQWAEDRGMTRKNIAKSFPCAAMAAIGSLMRMAMLSNGIGKEEKK